MNRKLLRLAVPVVLAFAVTACGGGSSQPKVSSKAPTDHVLRLSFLQDPGQPPDPDIYYAGQGLVLTQNLYEGLLQYETGVAKPTIVPALATKWTVSPDKTTYTLTLRAGVTFHDGTPFTSAAVKPSFDRRLAVNQGPAYMVTDVTSVTTPSPTEVVIKLKSANSAFLDYLASPYGPKMMSPALLKSQAGKDHMQTYLQTHDAGTGPYTLTKAQVGQTYEMKAYAKWWGTAPYFQTVELPVISDLSTQQLLLNKGQLHGILHDLNAPAVKSYLGNSAVSTYSLPSFTTEQVYVNPNSGLLKDVAARKAFQQAMDVESLRKQVFTGRSDPATGNYPQGLLTAGTDIQSITAGTAALKAIAASATDKKIVLGYDTSQPDDQQLANLVGAKLQSIGLTPTVQGYTTSQVFGWIGNQKGAPSVLFSSFWPDAAHPYTAAHILYAPDGGLNYLGCSDPAVTALLPGALKSGDNATFAKIGELATATGCWTNIAYRKDFMVTQTWLKGVEKAHDISAPMSLRIADLSA
ncbi:MAG: transporter substrate-binding protein [Frankiales bacterium]|nr:transporter substrate-binding protein [Frankiales bacterium]